MEYKCPKCNAILIKDGDDYKCEYCKSEYNIDYLNNVKNINYVIPFEIDKNTAIKEYTKLIKVPSLTPKAFKKKKYIKKIEGIYIPCYIYTLDSTGEIEFEGSKISTWKSSGNRYKKSDIYNIVRGANMHIDNMLISTSSEFKSNILNCVEPYDYKKLIEFNQSYVENYKVSKPDKAKKGIKKDIEDKTKDIFIRNIKKDIKNYRQLKIISERINIYNVSKKHILLPVWLLNINYKKKKYTYIINGQSGNISGNIPINKKKTIFIWISVFVVVFILLLFLSLFKELI